MRPSPWPRYLHVTGREKGRVVTLAFRLWHPSFWRFLWDGLRVEPRWAKPVGFLWAIYQLCRHKTMATVDLREITCRSWSY